MIRYLLISLFTLISFVVLAKDVVQDKSIDLELVRDIANEAGMAWSDNDQLREARRDIQQELNHIDGLIVMDEAIKIVASGYNLGAVGISGTPGGKMPVCQGCIEKAQ